MTSQELFERIYERHAGAIKGYAVRRIGAARADDVVAEVFLIAWRRLADVPDEPRPWLFGVARRVLANERRRQQRHEHALAVLPVLAGAGDPAEGPASASSPLSEALANLNDSDRETLLLSAWEGLSHREAARVLGLRESTFTVRLHRAKRRLERAMRSSQPTPMSPTRLETP